MNHALLATIVFISFTNGWCGQNTTHTPSNSNNYTSENPSPEELQSPNALQTSRTTQHNEGSQTGDNITYNTPANMPGTTTTLTTDSASTADLLELDTIEKELETNEGKPFVGTLERLKDARMRATDKIAHKIMELTAVSTGFLGKDMYEYYVRVMEADIEKGHKELEKFRKKMIRDEKTITSHFVWCYSNYVIAFFKAVCDGCQGYVTTLLVRAKFTDERIRQIESDVSLSDKSQEVAFYKENREKILKKIEDLRIAAQAGYDETLDVQSGKIFQKSYTPPSSKPIANKSETKTTQSSPKADSGYKKTTYCEYKSMPKA